MKINTILNNKKNTMWLNSHIEIEANTPVNQWAYDSLRKIDIIDESIIQEEGVNVLIPKDQYEIFMLTDTIVLSQVNIFDNVWLLNTTQFYICTVLKINMLKYISELKHKLNTFRFR